MKIIKYILVISGFITITACSSNENQEVISVKSEKKEVESSNNIQFDDHYSLDPDAEFPHEFVNCIEIGTSVSGKNSNDMLELKNYEKPKNPLKVSFLDLDSENPTLVGNNSTSKLIKISEGLREINLIEDTGMELIFYSIFKNGVVVVNKSADVILGGTLMIVNTVYQCDTP
jgi:hypothetical protein